MTRFVFTLLAGLCGFANTALAQADNTSDEGVEFRLTGDERVCINKREIEWFMAVDYKTLLFSTSDGYYFNKLLSKCNMAVNANLHITVYNKGRTNFCKGDGFTTRGAKRGSTRCVFNKFEKAVAVTD